MDAAAAATASSSTSSPPPLLPPAINALTPEDHVAFMRRAIALSRAAGLEQRTGGCFGAVVVCSETKKVLGEGQNRVLETNDPTAHGEVVCLRDACSRLGSPHLPKGAVIYTSSQMCPMCHAALLWSRSRSSSSPRPMKTSWSWGSSRMQISQRILRGGSRKGRRRSLLPLFWKSRRFCERRRWWCGGSTRRGATMCTIDEVSGFL